MDPHIPTQLLRKLKVGVLTMLIIIIGYPVYKHKCTHDIFIYFSDMYILVRVNSEILDVTSQVYQVALTVYEDITWDVCQRFSITDKNTLCFVQT